MSGVHVLSVDGSEWVRLEDYRALEQQLAEARAALKEIDPGEKCTKIITTCWDLFAWRDRHAAALKAAREQP